MKVVFDTNVIISRYLSPHGIPAQLLRLWKRNVFTLVTSEPILQEYKAAMLYKHIQALHRRNAEVVDQIVDNFRKQSMYVTPSEQVAVITNLGGNTHVPEVRSQRCSREARYSNG